MGQHASETNELFFQDCRIPKNALMGELNDGFRVAVAELAGGRIGIGSLALGLGYAAMNCATKYSLERRQFGKKISEFQAIQWKIADCYTELEAARLLLMSAGLQKRTGEAVFPRKPRWPRSMPARRPIAPVMRQCRFWADTATPKIILLNGMQEMPG